MISQLIGELNNIMKPGKYQQDRVMITPVVVY